MKNFLVFLVAALSLSNCFAVTGSFQNALKAKAFVEVNKFSLDRVQESIILPLSKGLVQDDSELCWSFSTLNFLESHYLYLNPTAKNVSLSRAAMQRNNAEERALRAYILKNDVFMERGTFTNALEIISKYGLMPLDSKPLKYNYGANLKKALDAIQDTSRHTASLKGIVDGIFFPIPEDVVFDSFESSPAELATLLVDKKMISYAFKNGATGFWGNHPDTDAFKGAQSWYVAPEEKEEIIKEALLSGYPVEMTFLAHSVIIYGADYDVNGKALKYYIKDSYFHGTNVTYEAYASRLHSIAWELGTADLR